MHVYLPIANVAINLLAITGAGVAVGFLSGMFGVGGGFLITPLLIFLGIPPEVAIATGANQAVGTSVAGATAHWRRGNVDLKLGTVLLLSGLLGSMIGVRVVAFLRAVGQFDAVLALSYVVLLGVVGSFMLIESLGTIWQARSGKVIPMRRGGQHTWIHGLPLKMRFNRSKLYISVLPPIVVGALVGVLSALMGVGGGFVLVPAMVYLLKVRTSVAIGTSMFQILFVSAFTTLLQASIIHSVDILLAVILIAGGVIGTQFGVRAGEVLKGEQLRALLALLVLAVCARVAYELVATPVDLYSLSLPGR